ncbi:MAG: DUF4097 domain-containing protein [Oscillospiraceae bacterium]|nr:DUF4097 domain-containing protein [Oscillospiraceae bacterium]
MKKIILLIALIAILIGGILAVIAFGLGAETALYWDRGFRVADTSSRTELNTTLSPFSEIELNVGTSDLTLRYGDEFRIEGHHYGTITYEVNGNRLTVNAPSRRVFLGWDRGSGHITITVPDGTALDSANFSLGVGNIRIQDVSLHNATLDSGVGNINVTANLSGRSTIEIGVGDIDVRGMITGDADLSGGVGNVTVHVEGSLDRFSYTASSGVGRVSAGGAQSTGLGGNMTQTAADPLGTIRVDSGVGDVTITFTG